MVNSFFAKDDKQVVHVNRPPLVWLAQDWLLNRPCGPLALGAFRMVIMKFSLVHEVNCYWLPSGDNIFITGTEGARSDQPTGRMWLRSSAARLNLLLPCPKGWNSSSKTF